MLNINNIDKKGIYKDLYRTLEVDKKDKLQSERLHSMRPRKGIYKEIYKNIEDTSNIRKTESNTNVETICVKNNYPMKALVFSNDIGEALRPIFGKLAAKLSWIPSLLYTAFSIGKNQNKDSRKKEIVFQGIANFLLPFLLIKASRKTAEKVIDKASVSFKNKIKNQITKIHFINNFINKFKKENSSGYRNFTLASVGLLSIAAGAKPIDKITKNFLDKHFYKPENSKEKP